MIITQQIKGVNNIPIHVETFEAINVLRWKDSHWHTLSCTFLKQMVTKHNKMKEGYCLKISGKVRKCIHVLFPTKFILPNINKEMLNTYGGNTTQKTNTVILFWILKVTLTWNPT
jgi:hypothetical protein